MRLQISTVDGVDDFAIQHLELRRGLGIKPLWVCCTEWSRDGSDRDLLALAKVSGQRDPIRAMLFLEKEKPIALQLLGANVGGNLQSPADLVLYLKPAESQLRPLRRVISGRNTAALFGALQIEIVGNAQKQGLPGALQNDRLPAGSCAIVDGVTVVEAGRALLHDYRQRQVQGGKSSIISGRLGVVAGEQGDAKLVCASGDDGFPLRIPQDKVDAVFGKDVHWSWRPGCNPEGFTEIDPQEPFTRWATLQSSARAFEWQAFSSWQAQRFPAELSLNNADNRAKFLAHHAIDRLAVTRTGISWSTHLRFYPEVLSQQDGCGFSPWLGTGVCVGLKHENGLWVRVALDGFEEPYREVLTRLHALYTGNGNNGLHLPPQPKTKVAVLWSGRVGDSPICLGNVRIEEPAHPGLTLDFPKQQWRWKFEGGLELETDALLAFKANGAQVSVASTMDVKKA